MTGMTGVALLRCSLVWQALDVATTGDFNARSAPNPRHFPFQFHSLELR